MNPVVLFLVGASALFLTVGISAAFASHRLQVEVHLASLVPPKTEPLVAQVVAPVRRRTASGLIGSFSASQEQLLQAVGITMPIRTWLFARLAFAVLGLVLMIFSVVIGVAVLLAAWLAPNLWLSGRRSTIRLQIERDLPDALVALASGLRGGLSINQALATLQNEVPGPLGELLREAHQSTGVGESLDLAFERIGERTRVKEFHMLATAISIQRQSGGNLSEVLDSVADVIGEKLKLRQRVKALTAEPRLSAWVLSLLPVGVGLLIFIIDSKFISPLFTTMIGRVMLGFAVLLDGVGALVIRSVTRLD